MIAQIGRGSGTEDTLRFGAVLVGSWLCCCGLPSLGLAESDTIVGSTPGEVNVAVDAIAISADFEGAIDPNLSTAYFCKGIAQFIAAPTSTRPDNLALLLTLDPRKPGNIGGRCDPPSAPSERAELAETDELRLPQGIEVWYGFRFMIPRAMAGKFAGQRLVLAQLKQHPAPCTLSGPLSVAISERNPAVSLRVIEDTVGDTMGLQLAVSSDNVGKISVGQLMERRDSFLDVWHQVVLHLKVAPGTARSEHAPFLAGWLDGQAFNPGVYGLLDDGKQHDPAEPLGYSDLFGCTYFKFGIYRDRQKEPWSIAFDDFRRGSNRLSVEAAAD